MFKTYHSNDLEVLRDILLHLLQRPLANPLQQEVILVQSPGMSHWLKLSMAEQQGIAANLRFPLPATFIWELLYQLFPHLPKRSPYDKEWMRWRLMRLLLPLLSQPDFAVLAHYLEQAPALKLYQLCGRIADLFDQYLVYRPDWILAWEAGQSAPVDLATEERWQPQLWRYLVADIEQGGQQGQHRARLIEQAVQRLGQPGVELDLPERLAVFGISALPPAYVHLLHALGQHRDVHLFIQNPCQEYWGDILDPSKAQDLGSVGNSLLASMGKLGRDYLDLLLPYDPTPIEAFVPRQTAATTPLLAAVQQDILQLRQGPAQGLHVLQADDQSIQIHSAYSALREVEMLHDWLLQRFASDPSLKPRDVLVMMPDVRPFAPFIEAVFGQSRDQRFIPWAIADMGLGVEQPLLQLFMTWLALPDQRFSLSQVMDWLAVPALAQRFALSPAQVQQLADWLARAGVRWGLDQEDYQRQGLPERQHHTWAQGLERLLAGYSLDAQQLWQDIWPLAGVSSQNAEPIGGLWRLLQSLAQWRSWMEQERSLQQWSLGLQTLLDEMFEPEEQELWLLEQIRAALMDLQQQSQQADYEAPLPVQVVRAHLSRALEQRGVGQRFLAGQVNFCTLMPMRSVPFRLVCLLGMNDGDYPRQVPRLGFDLMQSRWRRGDRSRRDDDRYLFLEALLSAREGFYISYQGRDQQDNHERPPSVLVSELLDYLGQHSQLAGQAHTDGLQRAQQVRAQLCQQHPLFPFAEQYFNGQGPRSYQHEWLAAAQRQAITPTAFCAAPLSPLESSGTLELNELLSFARAPWRYFMQQRLRVYWGQEVQQRAEVEPQQLQNLTAYQARDLGLQLTLQGKSGQSWQRYLHASGLLPQPPLANLALAKLEQSLAPLQQVWQQQGGLGETREVDLQLAEWRLQGWLRLHQGQLLSLRAGKVRGQDVAQLLLSQLVMAAQGQAVSASLYGQDNCVRLQAVTAEQARAELQLWLQTYAEGWRQPLPIFIDAAWTALHTKDGLTAESLYKAWSAPFAEGEQVYVQRLFPAWSECQEQALYWAETLVQPWQERVQVEKLAEFNEQEAE